MLWRSIGEWKHSSTRS